MNKAEIKKWLRLNHFFEIQGTAVTTYKRFGKAILFEMLSDGINLHPVIGQGFYCEYKALSETVLRDEVGKLL